MIEQMRQSLFKSHENTLQISSELSRNQEQLDRAQRNVFEIEKELGISGYLLNTIERLRKKKRAQFYLVLLLLLLTLIFSLVKFFI